MRPVPAPAPSRFDPRLGLRDPSFPCAFRLIRRRPCEPLPTNARVRFAPRPRLFLRDWNVAGIPSRHSSEILPLLQRRFAFRLRVGQLGGLYLFPARRWPRDGAVQKALQQPHQKQEVERLRPDGEPVNEHGIPAAWARRWFQNGLAEKSGSWKPRSNKWPWINHGQAHEQSAA